MSEIKHPGHLIAIGIGFAIETMGHGTSRIEHDPDTDPDFDSDC